MGWAAILAAADRVSLDTLGDSVTYTPTTGCPVEVTGIYDAVYERVDVGTPGISSFGPAVFLLLSDLPSDPSVDLTATVTIDGTEFEPWEVKPDGQGGVLLLLHKTS